MNTVDDPRIKAQANDEQLQTENNHLVHVVINVHDLVELSFEYFERLWIENQLIFLGKVFSDQDN